MRARLEIAEDLLRQAKRRAADEGVPLRRVVESALSLYLAKPCQARYTLQWRTEKGRLRPGVCLDDRKSLLDFMDKWS